VVEQKVDAQARKDKVGLMLTLQIIAKKEQ